MRLGLAGGGTDLPEYAGRFGGAVLNATIERYAFASVAARTDGLLVFDAGDLDRRETHAPATRLDSRLDLHRGVYERMIRQFNAGVALALTVATSVEAPLGSGLGSSSALVVALVQAYAAFLGRTMTPRETAMLACDIERRDLGLAGGHQDQYAAAFGGVNMMRFPPRGDVVVDRLRLPLSVARELEASLALCFSGQARESAGIIAEQARNVAAGASRSMTAMHRLKDEVAGMRDALLDGDLAAFAAGLDRSWQAKQATASGIVTARTEALEALARASGATAVKVSGAGGGGFAMCLVQPERRARLIAALQAAGHPTYPVRLTDAGAEAWLPHRPAQVFPAPGVTQEPSRAPAAVPRPSHPVPAQQGREAARV